MQMKNLSTMWAKAVKKCDTYVICSTLNQVVNYMPLKMIVENTESDKVFVENITYIAGTQSESNMGTRFNNEAWDENLETVINDNKDIKAKVGDINDIQLNRSFNQEEYQNDIEKVLVNAGHTILWNLTGGQRQILLAVQGVIEKDCKEYGQKKHMIFYLEGNTQRIIVGSYGDSRWEYAQLDVNYEDKELNISTLFKLAGFEAKPVEEYFLEENRWTIKSSDSNYLNRRNQAYMKFFDVLYRKNKKELLTDMVKTNRLKDQALTEFNRILDDVTDMDTADIECIKESLKTRTSMTFGYFLEYLSLAVVLKEITEGKLKDYCHYFRSVGLDVKVYHKGKNEFCQLDIVLTLKAGQAVFFECKSGSMRSETGKAREYTAYALGGVYGMPLLITPLRSSDTGVDDKEDVFKYIFKAVDAAGNAGLNVCFLDTIGEDLKVIFRELFD